MSNEFSRFFRSLERDKQYTLKRNAIVKKEFDRRRKTPRPQGLDLSDR